MTVIVPAGEWARSACRRIDTHGRRLHAAVLRRVRSGAPERGDVPGWVMVTVMTAILVVAILAVFEPQIKSAISSALDSVTNSK
jgi:hypothetical protein